MVALGVGNYMKFMDQMQEIAGDNVYTADNFDELSNLFDEILVEGCSKYSLREIVYVIHFITTLKAEIRTDTFYHNNDNARLWPLFTRATRGLGTRTAKGSVMILSLIVHHA